MNNKIHFVDYEKYRCLKRTLLVLKKKKKKNIKPRTFYITCPHCKKRIKKDTIIKSGFFICPCCHDDLPKFKYKY